MSNVTKIPTLNESNYQEFLEKNLKEIFVYETKDYDYHHYFPSHYIITDSCKVSIKYKLQG